MAQSSARMEIFECPICAPKRYFVTEIGLRTHVADRHPWRSLPPAQQRIPPTRAAMPEPAWLRDQQMAAARSDELPGAYPYPTGPISHPQLRDATNHPGGNHQAVTFDTQSQLSDDVFFDDGSGGGRQAGHQLGLRSQNQRPQPPRQQNYDTRDYNDNQYPAPDYDPLPSDLLQAVDSVDSSSRKKRELATSRRPWYDSDDYAGPRNVMEQPGGYYQFEEAELNGPGRQRSQDRPPQQAGLSKQRMRRELDDRDSHIETLRLEIDRLWDERMRLLKVEAERTRTVKDQSYGLQPLRQHRDVDAASVHSFRLGRDQPALAIGGHAFQPVVPHSRLQMYRSQYYPERGAIDY